MRAFQISRPLGSRMTARARILSLSLALSGVRACFGRALPTHSDWMPTDMIEPGYARKMAAYNQWQNENILKAASSLDPAQLEAPKGAFFSSIRRTMSHILWADLLWLHRFSGSAKPEGSHAGSPDFVNNWAELARLRPAADLQLTAWAEGLDPVWLAGAVEWPLGAGNGSMQKPAWLAVAHMFNHQTHHRGQVHAMLTATGSVTDPTDLLLMS